MTVSGSGERDVETHRHETSMGALLCLEAGSGPPLLYLHGVGDSGAMIPAIARLAARRRLIRPDHPGFLRSADAGFDGVADFALGYARLLDEEKLDRVDLVGCSLGGWIAAETALLRPERIRTLTLIDPAGLVGDEPPPDTFALSPAQTVPLTFATRAFRQGPPPSAETAALLARSRATARRVAGDPYMHDPGLAGRLAALRMLVHLIWGRQDGIIPASTSRAWTDALPHTRLTVIDDAGHLPHVEQPEAFRAATGHLEN
ncbi:alpha/beta hydrolase [Microbacterium pseudoresistens]|uniref:Pimeloyl-ACP methyl ester carboxylesterase n=1 Tax=Microbacterium pseudoresistens TaxID=640634 RepID=A0A7Y9JPR4_9MICO|nr:alpha/beta hydrolase [Microbacterium pseudoresistens]NYD54924.1 pimeloyl-ACP methyl ester carboxylesterase [Microbacterium pseudoresistens]